MTVARAPTFEFICTYTATLSPPEIIGPVAEGVRANFYVTGGVARGPRLDAQLRPVGGDWLTIRPDGVGILDVRATFETHDGALIDVAYRGIGDLGPDGYAKFLRGELPAVLPLRTTPVMRSAHPSYQWLQREILVGVGSANFERLEVAYDLYVLR